ncbi:MAG: hypothetical protein P1V97_07940 [Planctomycetota bacterium]|nr:hypothetical protein [Planctomycetota bacterium]
MSLFTFLNQLWHSGRVEVSADQDAIGSDESKIRRYLRGLSQQQGPDLPFSPPPLDEDAALWASIKLYRAAQFLVYLEAKDVLIQKELSKPYKGSTDPASLAYSVDLSFRFLGDLLFLAQKNKGREALVTALQKLATQWPLSSVGIPGLQIPPSLPFLKNPCLKQLYVDRIIAQSDLSRLTNNEVRDSVKAALGMYPEFSPELAKALENDTDPAKE